MDPVKNEFPIEWLRRKYKDMGIDHAPTDFQMSQIIVTAFNKLKQRNEEADNIMEKFSNRSQIINDVVVSEASKPSEEISDFQVNLSQIPTEVMTDINTLIQAYTSVPDLYTDEKQIKDNAITVEMSNVAVDIAQLVLQKNQTIAEAKEVDSIIKNTTENINEYQMQLEIIKENEGPNDKKLEKEQNISSLEKEIMLLEQQLSSLTEEQQSLGETRMQEAQLESILAQLAEQKTENAKLQSSLDVYNGLPHDVKLAKSALQQKQQELEKLRGEIAFLVSVMAPSF